MSLAGPRTAITVLPSKPGNGAVQLQQMAGLLFLGVLLMSMLSADTISRERREGTLGSLFLTKLTPNQIVYGKLLSCGLTSFLALIGCLPALMLPVLAGGVTGRQAALTGIGLLNSLFVSLAAGLWMSSIFRERRYVMPATLAAVATLAFGPEVLCGSYFGPTAAPIGRLFSLAGWMTATRLPAASNSIFLIWFAATHALGWGLLWLAAMILAANWMDQPRARAYQAAPAGSQQTSRTTDPRQGEGRATAATVANDYPGLSAAHPWEDDPIRWRIEKLGQPEALIWPAMALNFLVQLGLLGPQVALGFMSIFGIFMILGCGGMLAWAGARFFQDSRRQQDLELLLTTPVGGRDIIIAQWQVLRRALAWPIGLLLLLSLPAGIALTYHFVSGSYGDPWFLLHPFLIVINLVLEALALCWTGMRFGLSRRNAVMAVTATLGWVHLLPLGFAIGTLSAWVWLTMNSPLTPIARSKLSSGSILLLFFMVKNLVLILWARWSLHHQLRLGSSNPR